MEKIAYGILGALAGANIVAMLIGVVRVWPDGLVMLALILGFGLLLIKILMGRLEKTGG